MATLDARPDPPAVNPNTAQCKVLQLHDYSWDAATPRCDSPAASSPLPVRLVAADAWAPDRPSDRMILAGQAADSSPPATLVWT